MRGVVRLGLALAVALGPAAVAAFAADTHGATEEKKGLYFMALDRYDLGIFTLIVFGGLCFVLFKYAWPKISDGLDKREAGLLALKGDAERAKQDAEDVRAKLHAEFATAQDKIRAMMDEARRDAEGLRAKERETGSREAAAERERAKREIESAKDAALAELYQQSVDLATKLSAKTLGRSITADDHRRLLDESVAELKQVTKA
jgi:F-type H+-transporting ATPase subunit b